MSHTKLPEVPEKHSNFIQYVTSHPDKSVAELLEPFKQYDAKLREVFAQETDHPALSDDHLNIVPVFDGHQHSVKVRARDLDAESIESKEKYVMPLGNAERHPNGSPAIVQDIKHFQQNFALFCESALVDLDWTNVVAAGSSVVTCLLPVPEKYRGSKRALRQYYHETIAPASDVDLFLYGLSEDDAIKKIIQIEQRIKDSILTETTTIRTKNAITIASQYPTRHIQIVLRIYKSVSEILTGFDVDCSCAAYDGKQIWAAPRALAAYMTQTNTIDLTRRSPSYENRLSKYSHRGFEVHWPLLERSRIDPTIFERNFARTVGLARLLVLERLPSKSEREAYMDERREERGRPAINRHRYGYSSSDNIKEKYEDEVAEWVNQEDVSDYHTFTIPYGPSYHAKKIEKLLYTKDLLLNAEWNKRDDREVTLHRHPAFFGFAEDIIHDCCGYCPKPLTPEEEEVAEEEAKIYVSGEVSFIKDDPGRQAIGSFHPITDDDWTEMAYVGNTSRLCQAIVDEDLEHVEDWLSQDGSDPNCRDYTGRTPLHLAVMSSTTAIVKALIDHGARLVSRLADGRTALHLAAARGDVDMVKMILYKSEENEEEESKKADLRKKSRISEKKSEPEYPSSSPENDIEMIDAESDDDMKSTTTGSYIKVKDSEKKEKKKNEELVIGDDNEDEPDVYDVNVLAWDTKCSPLHFAILNGHVDVVKELVQTFGADVLLPIKLLSSHDKSPCGAILTLVLALRLPLDKAKAMTQALLEIGASSAQADTNQTTALHYISGQQPEVLQTLFEFDEPAAKRAINHLSVGESYYRPDAQSPLMSAILTGNALAAIKLLEAEAAPNIDFKDWIKSAVAQHESLLQNDTKQNHAAFVKDVEQPIISAVEVELPEVVHQLLDRNASPNTLTKKTQEGLVDEWYQRYNKMESLLDVVRSKISELENFRDEKPPTKPTLLLKEGVNYLDGVKEGSYKYFIAKKQIDETRFSDKQDLERYERNLKEYDERKGITEKKEAIATLVANFKTLEEALIGKGAKTFRELHPEVKEEQESRSHRSSRSESTPRDWVVTYDFTVHDLTDEKTEAYLRLFQAAWDGDLVTIKDLTTTSSDDNPPLTIAVRDAHDQSPFTLAVLRGHLDVARAIVEVSFAQYHPDESKPKTRYRMGNESEDDEDDDSSDIPVYKEIVNDKFTIENIAEISSQVKSKVTPLSFISWSCSVWKYSEYFLQDKSLVYGLDNKKITGNTTEHLTTWAIITNDKTLFAFLLDLKVEWTNRLAERKDDSSILPSIQHSDFLIAIEYGRLDILAEMIKHTGAGMELESLVKKSGVKYREKPKFYQGLTVYGKKRDDWVSAARGEYVRGVNDSHPPLLQAAFAGSLSSVEWLLSDTPTRHYLDFAEAYKHNKLITHLNTAAGGFEKVLRKCLGARRDLALHCAVMADPTVETLKLIEYLLKVMPNSLETKSSQGHTPLTLAFSLRRYEAAKILIAAGADQCARNAEGANILHLVLLCGGEKTLQKFLDLIDTRLVASLLTERSSHSPGSLTPIAHWLRKSASIESLRIILDFATPTRNQHLELLDGSGDTPLHYVVKSKMQGLLKVVLEYRPDLLYRENSVGRTPYELAEDAYIAECVSKAPSISRSRQVRSLVDQHYAGFIKDEDESECGTAKSVWHICDEFKKVSRRAMKAVVM